MLGSAVKCTHPAVALAVGRMASFAAPHATCSYSSAKLMIGVLCDVISALEAFFATMRYINLHFITPACWCIGDVVSVNEGQNVVKDSIIRLDSTAAAAAVGGGGGGSLRPTMDGIVNGPTSYPFTDHPAVDSAILSSPNSRQQLSEQNKSRRPLIGQGMMNAADAPAAAAAAAANYGTLPQSVTHTPVGRPIVKGSFVKWYSCSNKFWQQFYLYIYKHCLVVNIYLFIYYENHTWSAEK